MSSCIGTIFISLCLILGIRKKIDGFNLAFAVFNCSWTVFLEPESRRNEICLYILPRFLEAFWNMMKHRKFVKPVPGGENIVFALATGLIAYFYNKEDKAIKNSLREVFQKFWGIN